MHKNTILFFFFEILSTNGYRINPFLVKNTVLWTTTVYFIQKLIICINVVHFFIFHLENLFSQWGFFNSQGDSRNLALEANFYYPGYVMLPV